MTQGDEAEETARFVECSTIFDCLNVSNHLVGNTEKHLQEFLSKAQNW